MVFVALTLLLPAAAAAEVKIFRTDTREAVVEGALEGVSVDPLGAVELAPKVERLAAVEEPFVFAAAGHPEGWVVGTGNSGKALLIARGGEVTELAAVAEPEVFAVHADPDGTVYLGSSPHGKVYRVAAGGEAEEVFDPEESYIWALARDREGRLLVATGLEGRVYRLKKDGAAEVLVESRDRHVRSLTVLADGSVLAGTAGQGLILRVSTAGKVTTVFDAAQPEALAFAPAPDGTVYAAVLASEASQVDLSGQRPPAPSTGSAASGKGEATVVVVTQGEATVGSRGAGFSGPRSAVVEISPAGTARQVLDFQDETVHSLLWHGDELWIGTGQKGRLYRWAGDRLRQERTFEEQQLAALAAGGAGVAVATTNAAAVYRLGDGREPRGTYTSKVLDAGQVARFGSFLWQGSLPRGTGVELAFRSGMSSTPDDTWTSWSCGGCGDAEPCRDGEARCEGSGWRQEVPLGDVAHGRYVQWRATFAGRGEATPRLDAAELTYRQENLRPEVKTLEVLDPGQILVPQSFNPSAQTFEPWSPNRQGIFTTLRPEPANKNGGTKTLWKKGYRTLRWSAEDANGDELHYRLEFRPDGAGGADGWLPVADELEEDYYSFDAAALPDGIYRFRLTASDRPAQSAADALAGEKLSEPVVVDHTPPVLASREQEGGTVTVEVRDAFSPLRAASVSIDAGEWEPAAAADGLLDGRREVIRVAVPEGAKMALLRLTDGHHNVVTFDLLETP